MENYSRKNKISPTKEEKTPTRHHIKKGLSAFQKALATIGSIIGIITATITIMTFMNNNKSGNKPKSSQTTQTTIIKEIQKETTVEKSKANDTNTTSQGQTETSSASSDTKQSSNTSSNTSSSQTSTSNNSNGKDTTTSSSSSN